MAEGLTGVSLGEVYEAVKVGVRDGLIHPPARSEREAMGALFETVRKNLDSLNFDIDGQQNQCYAFPKIDGKGDADMTKAVAYYRVSTRKQGRSGLGLDAQKAAVQAFASEAGSEVLKDFVEVESGKKNDRPELAAALAFAKRAGATLIVAKLDRLARNVAFLSRLMESGIDFTACDMPHANRFTIHIMAALAEHERELISQRTKAALVEAKKRGVKLGSSRPGHWEGREDARLEGLKKGRAKSRKVTSEKAREEYADLVPVIQGMRVEGQSLQAIADALNAEGHRTRRGKQFHPATVQRILQRAEE